MTKSLFFKSLFYGALLLLSGNSINAQVGASLDLDGVDDYVDLGNSSSLKPTSAITVEMWANMANWTATNSPTFIGNTEVGGWAIGALGTNLQAAVRRNGTYGTVATPLSGISPGWHHLALTYDGQITAFYIDGALIGTNNAGAPFPIQYAFTNNTLIGAEVASGATPSAGRFSNGKFDEVRIWSIARSASDIQNSRFCEINGSVPNLLANYHFNQGIAGGNNAAITSLIDNSGFNFTGTLTAMALTGANSNWVSPGGVVSGNSCSGEALNFDGVDDRVNLGTSITSSLAGGNRISVEAWVRNTSAANLGNIVSNYNTSVPSNLGFLLRRANTGVNGNFEFYVGNGSTFVSVNTPANTNTLNVWTHVAGTWDGSVLRFYINGVLSATASSAPLANFATGGEVWIGGSNSNEFNTGDIDEVRIWNRTLCQGEIQNNMMAQLSIPQTSLIAYYQFNQGVAAVSNPIVTTLTQLAGPTGTLTNFALTGTTSNWVKPGGVVTGSTVVAYTSPTISVLGNSTVCSGASATFTATGASTYTWISGPNTANYVITPTVNATYSVVGTASNGCITNLATKGITVNATPTITVNSGTICSGNSFIISPSGASTYTYSGGTATVSPLITSAYTVTGTNTLGCSGSAISNVTVNAVPTITVNSGAICFGNSFTITPSGASTYTYSAGSAIISPTTNTAYTVTGTNTVGCNGSAVSNVTVNAVPIITVNSGAICSGNSFTITPSGASTYTYSGGSAVVSPTATAAYTVTGTNTVGCNGSAVSNVTVNAAPIITVNSGAICSGNSFTITPSGASTYTFSGGSAVVSPTATAAYTVTGTNTVNTCVGSAVSNVTVNANPIVNAVSTETNFICVGSSATLTASGASSYVWNTTATTAVIAVSPTTTTSYTVTGTNAAGCSAVAVISQSVSTCTDIKNSSFNISNLSFLVYPNPSNGIFNVQLESAATIEVTDVLGRVILTDNVNAGTYKLNLGNNVNGVYFVKATVDGKTKTVKIVKD
jgi:hypothetical protein